jgi:carbonic anhydrase
LEDIVMHTLRKPSRRDFCRLAAVAGFPLIHPRFSLAALQSAVKTETPKILTADESLHELLAGNERFVKGQTLNPRRNPADFSSLAKAQYPEAVIITCSDSRVAPEILFDVGVGDLFVVRVAGNVVDGTGVTVKGSTEYAIAELNVPLILVLGHSNCGAVKAAIQHINAKDSLPGAINGLVELIKPAVLQSKGQPGDPLENATIQNVKNGVARLDGLQPILAPRIKEGKVKVVGGVYDLKTGAVTLTS